MLYFSVYHQITNIDNEMSKNELICMDRSDTTAIVNLNLFIWGMDVT